MECPPDPVNGTPTCEWCASREKPSFSVLNVEYGVGWCSLKCESEWKAHHKDNLPDMLADLNKRRKEYKEWKIKMGEYLEWAKEDRRRREDLAREERNREREKKKQEEAAVEVFSGVLILAFLAVFLGFPLWFIFFGSSS